MGSRIQPAGDRQTERKTERHRQTDREKDRKTGRQADREKNRQTDRQTRRKTERQTDRDIPDRPWPSSGPRCAGGGAGRQLVAPVARSTSPRDPPHPEIHLTQRSTSPRDPPHPEIHLTTTPHPILALAAWALASDSTTRWVRRPPPWERRLSVE